MPEFNIKDLDYLQQIADSFEFDHMTIIGAVHDGTCGLQMLQSLVDHVTVEQMLQVCYENRDEFWPNLNPEMLDAYSKRFNVYIKVISPVGIDEYGDADDAEDGIILLRYRKEGVSIDYIEGMTILDRPVRNVVVNDTMVRKFTKK